MYQQTRTVLVPGIDHIRTRSNATAFRTYIPLRSYDVPTDALSPAPTSASRVSTPCTAHTLALTTSGFGGDFRHCSAERRLGDPLRTHILHDDLDASW